MDKRPFIVDCDTGTDDAIAVIAAFGCEEICVRAITSVNGNAREKDTSRNNRNLMAHLGLDVDVDMFRKWLRDSVKHCGCR